MLAWCFAIFITPLLAVACKSIAAPIYFFFSFICHQLPERSFFLFNEKLAVCARCTGIYLSALLGVVIYPLRRPKVKLWMLIIASAPIVLDGGTQLLGNITQLGWWNSTNLLRITSGGLFGFVAALFILPALIETLSYFYGKLRRS